MLGGELAMEERLSFGRINGSQTNIQAASYLHKKASQATLGFVLSLMKTTHVGWKIGFDEFLPHEATTILSLPLSHLGVEDKLIWAATKNGIYSTKSAYQLLNDTTKSAATGPSNRIAHKNFWHKVWSLNVPSKI